MIAISARIPEKYNKILCSIADKEQRSKNYVICKAIEKYVLQVQEDIEDIEDAVKIMSSNEPTTDLDDVIEELDLKDEIAKNALEI